MSEQRLKESPEKAKLRIARRESRSAPVLHPILDLQRTLGNRRVAQLLQAKRHRARLSVFSERRPSRLRTITTSRKRITSRTAC